MRQLYGRTTALALLCALGSAIPALAESQTWEFSDVERIELDGVSGDLTVRPASSGRTTVELEFDVSPEGAFRGEVEQRGSTIHIEESWSGNRSRGDVDWTLYLPSQAPVPELSVDTSSGDFDCQGVAVRVSLDTASGDVRLSQVRLEPGSKFDTASGDYHLENMRVAADSKFGTASGDIEIQDVEIEQGSEFHTASGDVECHRCTGDLHFRTASGDVEVKESQFRGRAELSSASGDVSVHLDRLPANGLSASSSSGDVLLSVEQFGDDFTLVLVKRRDRGAISCPFDYTSESTFKRQHVYEKKVVKRGTGGPQIELSTASGRVTVKR